MNTQTELLFKENQKVQIKNLLKELKKCKKLGLTNCKFTWKYTGGHPAPLDTCTGALGTLTATLTVN